MTTVLKTFADPGLVIANTARVGKPLRGTVTRPVVDGLNATWQWQSRSGTSPFVNISGATGETYTPRPAQIGMQICVRLTLTAPGYDPLTVASTTGRVQSGVIARPQAKVTGTPRAGNKLTATLVKPMTLPKGSKLTYQWKLDGRRIIGATKARYRPTRNQVGKALRVTITITAPGYTPRRVTSKPLKIRR